ncbi:hypothetical protein HELRODRAFT_87171, partial [Helobdella robusta]|uniref:SANT and BTB domain-containing protein n=1 Tax=Helobdella robusta TaxID=6412 RepID=T1G6M8_HELRO
KDFTCPRELLLKEMKYFQSYLSNVGQQSDDVEISVHCDLDIFDWLIKYVKRSHDEYSNWTPKLDASNWLSILVSSIFLQMDSLVEECLSYVHDNVNDLLKNSGNLNCLDDKILARFLADKFSVLEVEEISDRKDKIKR